MIARVLDKWNNSDEWFLSHIGKRVFPSKTLCPFGEGCNCEKNHRFGVVIENEDMAYQLSLDNIVLNDMDIPLRYFEDVLERNSYDWCIEKAKDILNNN